MNRLITKKPLPDQKLTFAPMGNKLGIAKALPVKTAKKASQKPKLNPFAKKAATALAGK